MSSRHLFLVSRHIGFIPIFKSPGRAANQKKDDLHSVARIDSHSGTGNRFPFRGNPRFVQTSNLRAQAQKPLWSIPNPSGAPKNTLIRFDFPFRGYERSFGHTHRLFVASHQCSVGILKSFFDLKTSFRNSHRIIVASLLLSVAISRSFGRMNERLFNSHRISVASHATFVAMLRLSVRRHRASVRAQKLIGAFPHCLRNIIPSKQHTHVESRIPTPWR